MEAHWSGANNVRGVLEDYSDQIHLVGKHLNYYYRNRARGTQTQKYTFLFRKKIKNTHKVNTQIT